MSLTSELFKNDSKLEACLVSIPAHVTPGAVGDHVSKVQQALLRLDKLVIDPLELSSKRYGSSTAAAVLAYKQKRKIINFSYQRQADNIVGQMTIASLDKEMLAEERKPASPLPVPPPPVPPAAPEPLSNRFAIRVAAVVVGGTLSEPRDNVSSSRVSSIDLPQCYQVFDLVNQLQADYLIGSIGVQPFPPTQAFPRTARIFFTAQPTTLSRFTGPCVFKTLFFGDERKSFLNFGVSSGPVEMFVHLAVNTPVDLPENQTLTSVEENGLFQFQAIVANRVGARTIRQPGLISRSRKIVT